MRNIQKLKSKVWNGMRSLAGKIIKLRPNKKNSYLHKNSLDESDFKRILIYLKKETQSNIQICAYWSIDSNLHWNIVIYYCNACTVSSKISRPHT